MKYTDGIQKYVPLWGEWQVDEAIGAGAFGKVYKIYKMLGDEKVVSAAKYMTIPNQEQYEEAMLSIGNNHSTMRSYFRDITSKVENEIKLLYKLRGNSNIVSYEDYTIKERSDIGWDIIIKMEYVKPLDKHMETNDLTQKDILNLAIDICTGLKLCHDNGVIHRDIKDSNIFISDNGSYKIGDFGIATDITAQGGAMTRVGTPYYMAPEITNSSGYGSYDKTVDIYSLGIVLYRLYNKLRFPFMPNYPQPITFTNKEEAKMKRAIGEPMPIPVDADNQVWKVIKKACEYKSEDRYQNIDELKSDLMSILQSMGESEKNKILVKATGKTKKIAIRDDDETVISSTDSDETVLIGTQKPKSNPIPKPKPTIAIKAAVIIGMCLTAGTAFGFNKAGILSFNANKPITPKVDKIEHNSDQVTGIGQAGDEIIILVDGSEISRGVANDDGSFKIEIPRQEAGVEVEVVSTNKKGYMSDTVTMMVTKDTVTKVEDVYQHSEYVSGISEADNRISILKDNTEIASTVVNSDGTFKVQIEPQTPGTTLYVLSKYKDGRVSEKIAIKVKEEKEVDIENSSNINERQAYIYEIESAINEIEGLLKIKDEKGRPLYKVNEQEFNSLKDSIEKIKSGEEINLEDIILDIDVKQIEYGASS